MWRESCGGKDGNDNGKHSKQEPDTSKHRDMEVIGHY